LRQTITFDNGTEFAEHHRLRQNLDIQTFFCDPRAAWQKGGIENAIGRLRRGLPRKTDLATLAPAQIQQLAPLYHKMPGLPNPRPRSSWKRCTSTVTPPSRFRGNDGSI
jgi:IS30 family transposase